MTTTSNQTFSIRATEQVTRNAYRILGLPGNASQAAIHDAAGSLRRALKLGATKTTDWDLPWLGALNRTESEIQDAVGRLMNPILRLQERRFWFYEGEGVVRGLSLASLKNTATGWFSAPRPAARHDAAILSLLAAVLLDPEVTDEGKWLRVFSEWKQVVELDDYWEVFIDAEMEGNFEPAATFEEIEKVRDETLRLIANPLVLIAKDAVTRSEFALYRRTLHVFQRAGLPEDYLSDLENEILGPVEDSFETLYTDVLRQCSDNITRDDESAQANRLVCEPAVARFDAEVEPQLKRIVELAGSDSAVGCRAREAAARCLYSLARDWEWTYDWIGAESLLLRGRALAGETSAAVRIDEELERIVAFAQQQKIRQEEAKRTEKQERTEAALRLFVTQCAELRSDCAGKVKRDEESVAMNRTVCEAAVATFDKEVEPHLWILVGSVDADSDVAFRAREAAARCLDSLARDWEWTYDWIGAESLLLRGKALAGETSAAVRIDEELERIAAFAQQQKIRQEESKRTEEQERAEAALRLFVAQCAELRNDCASKVKRDTESVSTNRAVCETAVARFDKEVEPHLWILVGSVDADSDVACRAREAAAFCLHGLAIDSVWAEEFVLAETLLGRAKALAPSGSVALSRIEESLISVGVQAQKEQLGKAPLRAFDRWLVLGGCFAFVMLLILLNLPNPEQRSPSPPTSPSLTQREESLRSLKDKIDSGQVLISAAKENRKITQAALDSLAKKIEGYKSKITRYEQQHRLRRTVNITDYQRTLHEHDGLVDQYNQKLSEYQKDYADYEKRLEQNKRLVEEYNALVRQ
ncbi:MAG: hypothetical protein HY267_00495 [Deltaproteobacteria bacterium]|nr:hypothetical protein [Deltaproteobacteria bacterium]